MRLVKSLAGLLVAALIMPVCLKALADAPKQAVSGERAIYAVKDGSDKKSVMPCLSCCGGWKALVRETGAVVAPPAKKSLFVNQNWRELVHAPQLATTAMRQRAPPEAFAPPHRYRLALARTGRLLL